MPVKLLVKPHQYLLPEKSKQTYPQNCEHAVPIPLQKDSNSAFSKKNHPQNQKTKNQKPKPQTNSNKTPKISG